MISLLHLNKFILFVLFLIIVNLKPAFGEDEPIDIWEKKDDEQEEKNEDDNKKDITVENSTLSDDVSKIVIKIDENQIEDAKESIVGIFDPEENNLSLDMWSQTDGIEIKKILKRIEKLKLSKLSEDLLFQVLFTNAYAPEKNLSSEEFLKIKINWLINKKRIKDLENLLKNNPEVGQNSKAIKFLVNEYLSSADIKSACEKISYLDAGIQNNYLEKFSIFCLINNDRKDEAQLVFELLIERGLKDKFFEDKINFLLGINNKTNQKILDNNLLNFYLSYITSDDFKYEPKEKTNKYIWRYLSSANLIQVKDFEDENVIATYEQAASQNSFDKDEIFKIYLKMNFNFNQLVNSEEIYKNLPSFKARALIYQSMLLSDNVDKKLYLAFLLKDLFIKDKILNVYREELSEILKSINPDEIPSNYEKLVEENLNKMEVAKIKFDNDILHRSKVIKHFLEDEGELSRTEKDFKSVYKKIKKNKKYFISIKDIVVLESLAADGISLPVDLNYTSLSSELTVPKSLEDLANQNQIGLVMLKIVEIVGEDNVKDLDPETIYFLNRILNKLDLKKIRNNILSEALPVRV
tara:strand:+ start:3371 stop:5110 length:1740 start_codon:yes stop_codon:yes gene_type:complete